MTLARRASQPFRGSSLALISVSLLMVGFSVRALARSAHWTNGPVALEAPAPEWSRGVWYDSDGFAHLSVRLNSDGKWSAATQGHWFGSCEPVGIELLEGGLDALCNSTTSAPLARLGRYGPDTLQGHPMYWLYREPSTLWIVMRRGRRAGRRAWEWAVRNL